MNVCLLENAGPAALLMGPVKDAPGLPDYLPEDVGLQKECCMMEGSICNKLQTESISRHQIAPY